MSAKNKKATVGLKVDRVFTKSNPSDRYGNINFIKRSSKIVKMGGAVVFSLEDFLVPENFSQVAADVIAQKYFRKAGVPAFTKPVPEEGVPEALWRSEPYTQKLNNLPERQRFGPETYSRETIDQIS